MDRMKILRKRISPIYVEQALCWILQASDHPRAELEPDFDINDNERRYAKKIRKLHVVDENFWNGWLNQSGINEIVRAMLDAPVLIKHAAFIKRKADESFIPLHQDIALWEKKYESAVTIWVALTRSFKENGGMFYLVNEKRILEHGFDIRYPTFKCINESNPALIGASYRDLELDAGDLAIWPARTAHGSYSNSRGELRVGMPFVYVEKSEYSGIC